jgi:hypothetical protein
MGIKRKRISGVSAFSAKKVTRDLLVNNSDLISLGSTSKI